MKKISFFLILFTTYSLFAQETTGKVRTKDKYSKAILEINKGYLTNDFKAFDKYFAENGDYNVNGKKFKKMKLEKDFHRITIFLKTSRCLNLL